MLTAFFQKKQIHRIFAWYILPTILFYALTLCNPLIHNITHIYNVLDKKYFVFLWAFSSASYFYIYTSLLIKHLHYHNQKGRIILLISCLGMLISIFIPYDMQHQKILSNLHLFISIISTISYILLLYHILLSLSYYDLHKGFQYIAWYSILLIFSGGWILLYGNINTLSECSFVLCTSLYLYWLLR